MFLEPLHSGKLAVKNLNYQLSLSFQPILYNLKADADEDGDDEDDDLAANLEGPCVAFQMEQETKEVLRYR